MTISSASPTGRRSTWRRKLLFISGLLLILLVVAYFVVTSSAFFKGFILPRASKALGGEVAVNEASISPFSQVKLRQLSVKTTGTDPLLSADAVVLRYSLFAIVRGTLKMDEVTIDSPVVQIVENADGSSNLDPLLKKEAKPAAKPAAGPASTKPPQIDLKNFALKNATVRRIKNLKDGGREVTELTGVNITLDQLKNGQLSKLSTTASFKMSRPTNDVLEAKSTGSIEFTLGADLMPQSLKAKVEQDILRAEGSFHELAGVRTALTGDVTPTEIKELSERFLRGEQVLGEVKVSGPIDLAKKEGHLKLEVASIDRQVLNLIGAPLGIDFGTTTLNATTEVTLTQGGSVIAANTRFNAAKFSVTQKGQTTPPLDLQLACNVTVNTASESAEVQTFTLDGSQNQKQLLHGSLSKPMTVAWGKNAAPTGDSAFDLAVTDFDFAAWKPILGDAVSTGQLSSKLSVVSDQGGKQFKLGVTSQIAGLTAKLGAKQPAQTTPPLDLQLACNLTVNTDTKSAEVQIFTLDGKQNQQSLLHGSLSKPMTVAWGKNAAVIGDSAFDLAVTDFDFATWKPILGDAVSAGRLSSKLSLVSEQGGKQFKLGATSQIAGLTAKLGAKQPGQTTPPLDLQLACNVTVNPTSESAEVQTFKLDGMQNQKPLLHGSLSKPMTVAWGKHAAVTGDSAFDLAVTDFDFAAWKPILGDTISAGRLSSQINLVSEQGGKQLKLGVTSQIANLAAKIGTNLLTQAALQLKLNAQVNDFKKINLSDYRLELTQQAQPALTVSGSASYDGAAFNLQTQVEAIMARLLGSGSATPLSAGVKLDGSFAAQVLDLRQLQVTLPPTQHAPKNELNVAGRIDLATPGTTKGSLTAKADTLDFTQLYDVFTGNKSAATKSTNATPVPAPAGNVEPEPMPLPLQLMAEVNLGQVYLHDITMHNFQVTAKVDSGKITLDPCRLMLNGAPVTASVDLNLGVKGFIYALTLQMNKVPLEPIADTFSPNTRGQYQGLVIANAQIKGAGVTGASLQKNLNGLASFNLTNANLQLNGPKTKQVIVPIAALLGVPEITKSPLDWLQAQTEMGGGNIKLTQFIAQSAAFQATTTGVIPIAEVLTTSPLNLPIAFALSRSLAQRTSLLPANTPTNAAYATLPQFVTVTGTVGAPKADLNRLALGGLLLNSGVGIAQRLGVKVDPNTANLLQGVGSFLTGQKPAANTNQASTNTPAKFNPLDLFQKK